MTIAANMAVQQAIVTACAALPVASGVYDGPPARAAFPYIVISDGLVTDWSTKTSRGREVRAAITIWDDGDTPARLHALANAVEQAVDTIPQALDGWRIISRTFLRTLVARDPAGPWSGLVEYRFRLFED